eukprot:gene10444-5761_t
MRLGCFAAPKQGERSRGAAHKKQWARRRRCVAQSAQTGRIALGAAAMVHMAAAKALLLRSRRPPPPRAPPPAAGQGRRAVQGAAALNREAYSLPRLTSPWGPTTAEAQSGSPSGPVASAVRENRYP